MNKNALIASYALVHSLGSFGVNKAEDILDENMIAEQINDDIPIGRIDFMIKPFVSKSPSRNRAYEDIILSEDYWLTEDMCCIDMGSK